MKPCVHATLLALSLLSGAAEAASSSYLFMHGTSAEAGCREALQRLKLQRIAAQCGSQLAGGGLRLQGEQQDRLDRLYFESTAGSVVHLRLLKQQVDLVEPVPGERLFRCRVEAELEVQCTQGERDPQFAALFEERVALNQIHFKSGEEMVVEIQPQQAMALTILQLIPYLESERQVWKIFPNTYQPESLLQGSEPILIPDPERDSYQLIARLPSGKKRVVEELVVLATRTPVAFPQQMSVGQFHRLLAEIPLSDRRELFIPYEIIESEFRHEAQLETNGVKP